MQPVDIFVDNRTHFFSEITSWTSSRSYSTASDLLYNEIMQECLPCVGILMDQNWKKMQLVVIAIFQLNFLHNYGLDFSDQDVYGKFLLEVTRLGYWVLYSLHWKPGNLIMAKSAIDNVFSRFWNLFFLKPPAQFLQSKTLSAVFQL